MEQVLRFDEALRLVLERAAEAELPGTEMVPLRSARSRVLAEDLVSDRDQPPFARSTRDGFAMRAGGARTRLVRGLVRAGDAWTGAALELDDAVELMTGAPLPDGADAVVMVEHVSVDAGTISVSEGRAPKAGQNIVPRGAELGEGAVALTKGTRMGAAEIAVAASIGAAEVAVYVRPRVAILATGDELVEVGEQPSPIQIRNSNSYALAALVEEAGGIAERLPIARDTRDSLAAGLTAARGSDLLLLSGGVSAGKYDLVEAMLGEAGARFLFTSVRMQPGKPVVFGVVPVAGLLPEGGKLREQSFFGLPGNPVSTQVTFHCFVAPLLRAMGGERSPQPAFAQARLAEAVEGKPGLMRFLPAHLRSERAQPTVTLVPWQGSGDMAANARANCYAVLPGDREAFAAGEVISILLR